MKCLLHLTNSEKTTKGKINKYENAFGSFFTNKSPLFLIICKPNPKKNKLSHSNDIVTSDESLKIY